MTQKKVGRNDPCTCGSGKKYKQCCWGKVNVKRPLSSRISYKQPTAAANKTLKGGTNPTTSRPLKAVWINQPVKEVEQEHQMTDLLERNFGDALSSEAKLPPSIASTTPEPEAKRSEHEDT